MEISSVIMAVVLAFVVGICWEDSQRKKRRLREIEKTINGDYGYTYDENGVLCYFGPSGYHGPMYYPIDEEKYSIQKAAIMFTVGELAERCTGGNERAMRKLLNDAGAKLDEYTENPAGTVGRDVIVDLYATGGARIAGKLTELLRLHR